MPEKKPPRTVVIPAPIWMVSFGDTIALMLAFFVMLFAISSLEESQVARIISNLSTTDVDVVARQPIPNSNLSIEHSVVYQGINIPYIAELLTSKFEETPTLNNVLIKQNQSEILLILPNEVFDDGNGAKISTFGENVLRDLALVLTTVSNAMTIEGYGIPSREALTAEDSSSNFSNRWEIRLLRAANIAQNLRRNGLLSNDQIFGWSQEPAFATESYDSDTRVGIRITPTAGGQ